MTISQLHIIYVMVYTFVMGYLFGVSAYLLISKRNGFGSETLPSNRIRRAGGLCVLMLAQMSFYLMAYVFNFPGGLFFSAAINVLMATTMVWYADHHKVSLEIEQDYEAYQNRLRTLRSDSEANADDASSDHPSSEYAWIGARLEQYCKGDELYLQPDLTLDSLAHQIDTNRTYLSRYFSYVGTTYYHYINQLRIDYAVKLIHADPDINLNEIARNSGYSNGTSFRRAFAERVGCLPSEYRDRLAGKTDF